MTCVGKIHGGVGKKFATVFENYSAECLNIAMARSILALMARYIIINIHYNISLINKLKEKYNK
jgi:hypothetical protein